jgi:hypothetical protein
MSSKTPNRTRLGLIATLAAALILGTGLAMAALERHVQAHLTDSRPIEIPLAEMSTDLGDWHGIDEEPDEAIGTLTGLDEHRQLRFHKKGAPPASVLITYSGRPRQMLGHYPEVCYPAVGWHLEYTKDVTLRGENGTPIPAQLHFLTKFTDSTYSQIYIVNTLVNNGVLTTDKGAVDYRTIGQDRYVAQIQALFHGAENEAQVLSEAESLFGPLLEALGQHFQGAPLTTAGA